MTGWQNEIQDLAPFGRGPGHLAKMRPVVTGIMVYALFIQYPYFIYASFMLYLCL